MHDCHRLRWSDAWLLLAVFYARDRQEACLSAIMATADHINHAVMNYEELASGLVRLERAALIKVAPDLSSITCSREAERIIDPIAKRTRTMYETRREIERSIDAVSWTPKEPIPHPANSLRYPGLSREVYAAAVDAYLKSLKRKR